MFKTLGAGFLLLGALLVGGCIFGGGGGSEPPSVARPDSIPTATPPANLPEPVFLSQGPAPASTSTSGGAAGTYVVKSGDTLFGIAATLGITGEALAPWTTEVLRLNQLADGGSLRVGQELVLPVVRTPTPAATTRPATTPSTSGTQAAATATRAPTTNATPSATSTPGGAGGRTYTVASGDYPLLIAEKLNVPEGQRSAWANELLSLNGTTAAGLDVGDVLRLPASTP